MCHLLCQRSRVRFLGFNSVWFYLKSLVGPPSYLLWVPEARVAEGRENVLQPAVQHFAYYAFAAGEREDLWHSGFSLACVESVSFVGKVGTKAKNMREWRGGKGILFFPPPSSIFLVSLLLSRNNSNGNVCYEVISTRYRLRRTLRVGGKDVFFSVVCSHCWWRWSRCQSKYWARSRRSKPDFRVTRSM